MNSGEPTLASVVIIAKNPLPGKVKTRLIGEFDPGQAAVLAAAAIHDTIAAVGAVSCRDRVLLFDGDSSSWLPPGWKLIRQCDGDLDVRLSAGFEQLPSGPAVLVGMDTPQLQPRHLHFDPVGYDACLGLARDGGYWAIGFTDPQRARGVIEGVPMSQSDTGRIQYERMTAAGMRVQLLDRLTDVDTAVSARSVAVENPTTRFASVWRAMGQRSPVGCR